MSAVDLILQEQHLAELGAHVLRTDGHEGAAYALLGRSTIGADPWSGRARVRLSSHLIVPIPASQAIASGPDFVTWSTNSFAQLLAKAQREGLTPAIVHSHPAGVERFSAQDDANERELLRMAQNRNGPEAELLSVILTTDGGIVARLWRGDGAATNCDAVTVIGNGISVHLPDRHQQRAEDGGVLARQSLAFGSDVTASLRRLRIAIVGCGGTGSAVAALCARLGIGQILLIDDDVVDETNLNRLHLSRRSDADGMRPKAEVLAKEIADMGLGVRAVPFRGWASNPAVRDGLRSCDVVFGCTDDHDGRMLLNRFAAFYLIPVIDMGLAIAPKADLSGFDECSGRTTVLTPGAPCLLCRGVVDPVVARDEDLKRAHPEEYERRKREAYVREAGNPAPAVVTFTTETAIMAVNELLAGLTRFRGTGGWMANRVRRFDLVEDRRPGAERVADCPVCGDPFNWGRGDVKPFLDRIG